MTTLSRLYIVFLILLPASLYANTTPSANDIMQMQDERPKGDQSIGNSTLILIDKKGNQRKRSLIRHQKTYGKDEKSTLFLTYPQDVKGTTLLIHDWGNAAEDDETWIYFPSLKKTKRISASDRSGAFLGSDFSYSDISDLEISWYNFILLGEEQVDGEDVWHIAAKPKAKFETKVLDETGYTHMELWVRKDAHFIVQSKNFMKKHGYIKYLKVENLSRENAIWIPKKQTMVTTKNGVLEHMSVILIDSITFDTEVEDTLFNPNTLQWRSQ